MATMYEAATLLDADFQNRGEEAVINNFVQLVDASSYPVDALLAMSYEPWRYTQLALSPKMYHRLRIKRMEAEDKIEDELKKRGVVIDIPEEYTYYERNQQEFFKYTPTGLLAAALARTIIVLPQGRYPACLSSGFVGYYSRYEGAEVRVNGTAIAGTEITRADGAPLVAYPIDLTSGVSVAVELGSWIQERIEGEGMKVSATTKGGLQSLVNQDEDGKYHINAQCIYKNSLRSRLPFVLAPLYETPQDLTLGADFIKNAKFE